MASRAVVAQLSDVHVLPPGVRLGGVVDTNAALRAAVEVINGLAPQPDVVVVSGDVTEDGSAAAAQEARRILDGLGAPYWVMAGNHDRRDALRDAFAGRLDGSGERLTYEVDIGAARLLLLDSLVEDHDEGVLGTAQLAWLDQRLSADRERPVLVFVHHPPIDTGVWWMDTARLSDASAFGDVVERHAHVALVACGHVHRAIEQRWRGTTVSITPSTAFEVQFDLTPQAPPRAVLDRPAFHIHVVEDGRVVTHTVDASGTPTVVELAGFFGDWETTRAEWQQRADGLR
jgi:3',5'-cyclic AMP phosphodiesterase CpdA